MINQVFHSYNIYMERPVPQKKWKCHFRRIIPSQTTNIAVFIKRYISQQTANWATSKICQKYLFLLLIVCAISHCNPSYILEVAKFTILVTGQPTSQPTDEKGTLIHPFRTIRGISIPDLQTDILCATPNYLSGFFSFV